MTYLNPFLYFYSVVKCQRLTRKLYNIVHFVICFDDIISWRNALSVYNTVFLVFLTLGRLKSLQDRITLVTLKLPNRNNTKIKNLYFPYAYGRFNDFSENKIFPSYNPDFSHNICTVQTVPLLIKYMSSRWLFRTSVASNQVHHASVTASHDCAWSVLTRSLKFKIIFIRLSQSCKNLPSNKLTRILLLGQANWTSVNEFRLWLKKLKDNTSLTGKWFL